MDPPKPSAEEKSQNPDLVRCTNELNRDSIGETLKNNSEPSVFVNTEPSREDQVQNAVSFLSHPRVKGSPIIYRRSFLEKKGLTKDEIDEAFRRVPDPPPAVSSVQAADGQLKPSSSAQPQTQNLQTSTVGPVGAPAQTSIVSRFHWSHAFYAIGLLAVSGAGTAVFFKNAFVPRLKSWIRMVVLEEENELVMKANSKPSLAEEAAAAAKAAAVAASDVAKANQDILSFKSEERKYFEEFRSLLDVQVQEMKSMSNAIQQLEGQRKALERNFPIQRVDHKVSVMGSKPIANGKMDFDSSSVRSPLPPAPVESTAAPHPKSYMDIMAMIQRGEKPSNIREINDQPPNPYQPLSNPRLPPRPKPWELGSVQPSSNNVLPSQASAEGFNPAAQQTNDLLPGVTENGDDSVPWLQQHKNARIREIENGEELKTVSYGVPANERRIQQTWIPPQTPTVALPEAAAAIRHPKSTLPKEQLAIEPHLAHPNVGRDELQRITKLSKSGEEIDGGNLMPANLSELQDQE